MNDGTALLQNCQELFESIAELRDLSESMRLTGGNMPSCYLTQMDDIAERERKTTVKLKNTIYDDL